MMSRIAKNKRVIRILELQYVLYRLEVPSVLVCQSLFDIMEKGRQKNNKEVGRRRETLSKWPASHSLQLTWH